MDDLVKRLLDVNQGRSDPLCREAADRIETLEAEVARLKAAADSAAYFLNQMHNHPNLDDTVADGGITAWMVFQRDAGWKAAQLLKAALRAAPEGEG